MTKGVEEMFLWFLTLFLLPMVGGGLVVEDNKIPMQNIIGVALCCFSSLIIWRLT